MDTDALLENPPKGCEPIADLWSWAENESFDRGTCWLEFLDLIGYSRVNYGETINKADYLAGYVELDKLAKALSAYAKRPQEVRAYVLELELSEPS